MLKTGVKFAALIICCLLIQACGSGGSSNPPNTNLPNNNAADIQALQTRASSAESRLQAIENNAIVMARVSPLQANLQTIKTQITGLDPNATTTAASIITIQTSLTSLEASITALEDEIANTPAPTPYQAPTTIGMERLKTESQTPINIVFDRGTPRVISLDLPMTGSTPAEGARNFLTDYADLLGQVSVIENGNRRQMAFVTRKAVRNPASEGEIEPTTTDFIRFAQTYDGLPVFGAEILVGVDQSNSGPGRIFHTNGRFMAAPRKAVDVIPAISEQNALDAARIYLGNPAATAKNLISLTVFDPTLDSTLTPTEGEPRLAWLINIGNGEPYEMVIDAHDGSVLLANPLFTSVYDDFDLDVEDANGGNMGSTNCFNPTTIDDAAADEDEVYSGYQNDPNAVSGREWAIETADFYFYNFGQRSTDDDDEELEFYIHAGLNPPNANYTGDCGIQFSPNLLSQDIVTHEFTHGVIYHSSNLIYRFQSGALNESYGDIMGALSESPVDWNIGSDRLDGQGVIRSLRDPGGNLCGPAGTNNCGDPDTISGWVISPNTKAGDFGGVHTNSGIINKAHYLISEGTFASPIVDNPFNGFSVKGIGRYKTQKLVFWVMKNLSRFSGFIEARESSIAFAKFFIDTDRYGFNNDDVCSIRQAFAAVELGFGDFDCDGVENTVDDPDGDFINSNVDNCPNTPNPNQFDFDNDGIGAACDTDDDMDGVEDNVDNCLSTYNPDQQNHDVDALGDACDPDDDNDTIVDELDNCPGDPNTDQFDGNNNGQGDACDPDYDGDGLYTDKDNCNFVYNPPVPVFGQLLPKQLDSDGDGVGDACDLCPDTPDNSQAYTTGIPELGILPAPFQPDSDGDGQPDACDISPNGPGSIINVNNSPANPTNPTEVGSTATISVQDAEANSYVDIPVQFCPDDRQESADDSDRVEVVFTGLNNGITAAIIDENGQRLTYTKQSSIADRGMRIKPDCSKIYKVRLEFGSTVTPDENFTMTINKVIDSGTNPWTRDIQITASSSGNGSINPSSISVLSGDTASFAVASDSGYQIGSVSGCGGSLSGNTFTTGIITASCSINANFNLIPPPSFTVTTNAGANGSINPSSATVVSGTTSNFTVIADIGFGIDTISGCGGNLVGTTYTTGVITADCTVSATFIATGASPAIPATLSLSVDPTKLFNFSWTDVVDATFYRLLENSDGNSGFTQLGSDILSGTETFNLEVPLHARINAQYLLESCNTFGCTPAATLSISDSLASGVGYFKASNTLVSFSFGENLSISADGTTLAVAAYLEQSNAMGVMNAAEIDDSQNDNSASSAGAVYVFVKDSGGWHQQAYVKASNTDAQDDFGFSLSLSGDGNTLAVGARREDSNATTINGVQTNLGSNNGAVYVYVRNGDTWSQQAYVKSTTLKNVDSFGASVSLSFDGNLLAVGAIGEDSSATGINSYLDNRDRADSGAVYIFARSSTVWSQSTYIKPDIIDAGDNFGKHLVFSADASTLAVSTTSEASGVGGINLGKTDNTKQGAGAVYVFVDNGSGWSQQAYIKASNPDGNDFFGESISLSANGDTLAVGAPREDSAATGINGNQSDNSAGDPISSGAGAVYVYVRNTGVWAQEAYVKADDTVINDEFGMSVSLSSDGNTLAVGARYEDSGNKGVYNTGATDDASTNSGAAYLFIRDVGGWTQSAYIKASNSSRFFGSAIGISADGETIAVGAMGETSTSTGVNSDQTTLLIGPSYGAVYLY